MSELGDLVDWHLQKAGWRRADLARATGYSTSYITNILNGLRAPTPEAVKRIVVALKLQIADATALHRAAARLHGYEIGKR
jgi:transcriptional regulator with XRE-family HTH domain